jgi:hypothetical protein
MKTELKTELKMEMKIKMKAKFNPPWRASFAKSSPYEELILGRASVIFTNVPGAEHQGA